MGICRLEKNSLIVEDDLSPDYADEFQAMCAKLTATSAEEVVIDLSAVAYIGSRYFGEIIAVQDDLKTAGRQLVVRARRNVIDVMELLGLLEFLRVEEAVS